MRAYVDSVSVSMVTLGELDFADNTAGATLEMVTGCGFTPQLMTIAERIYDLREFS